jgi:hypothetical protein
MKCPSCFNLNMQGDVACAVCGTSLTNRPVPTPQWAYLFAFLCWGIPVAALGGCAWFMLASAGSSLCLVVARLRVLPNGVRMVLCFIITTACWTLFALAMAVAFNPNTKLFSF